MKARIICNGLNDVRDKVRELCDTSDVSKVYLPSNTKNNNHYGIGNYSAPPQGMSSYITVVRQQV